MEFLTSLFHLILFFRSLYSTGWQYIVFLALLITSSFTQWCFWLLVVIGFHVWLHSDKLKVKIGVIESHLSSSVSQRFPRHCICGQYRKKMTMGKCDVGNGRLDFWPWEPCRWFQNQSERRNPHYLLCSLSWTSRLVSDGVEGRVVLRLPLHFLLWVSC